MTPVLHLNAVTASFVAGGPELARLVFVKLCESNRLSDEEALTLALAARGKLVSGSTPTRQRRRRQR